MKTLEWHVLSLRNLPFELPLNLKDVIEDQFYHRWKMLTTNIHYARALFNPYLLGGVCLHDDANAKEIFKSFAKKTHSPTTYPLTLKKVTNFVESQGPFFDVPLVKDLYLFPHKWWDLIGTSGCTLAPIICHILAQVCSASSCKCNWSSYSFVHNKVWNQLTSSRAKDLMYIYTNNKLLQ
jgi:hypothetical protein